MSILEKGKDIFSFSAFLLGGSLLLFGGAQLVQHYIDAVFLSNYYVELCLFLFLVTVLAFTVSYLGIIQNSELGVVGILGGMTIKMIVSLSFFIFIMYRFPTENRVILGLNFFCIYLLMSCFEVIILLRILRRKIK